MLALVVALLLSLVPITEASSPELEEDNCSRLLLSWSCDLSSLEQALACWSILVVSLSASYPDTFRLGVLRK